MKIDISHTANLANLKLTDEEKTRFDSQLSSILTYIEKLNEVNTDNVAETSQVTGLENVLREDTVKPSLTQEEVLSQSTNTHNGMFVVKGVFENE